MTWTTRTVIEVTCNTCGKLAVDDDNAFWYQDRDTAREVLDGHGWIFTGDTAACHDCVQREACTLAGCDWGLWVDRVHDFYIGRTRTCGACDTTEYDPPLAAREGATP